MGRPLTVAVTGFAGLEDPGPGTSVAHALRQGWRGPLAIHAWIYGSQVNGAWLPGVIDRVEVLPPVHAGDQCLYEAILANHRKAPVDALLPGDADVPIIARLADRLADRGIRTLLPSVHRVDALARANLGKTLHERQIAGPLTISVPTAHEVAPLADRIGYPLFVRGVHFGERLVHSARQAHAEAERLNGASQPGVTLQYQVAGDRYSIGLVADRVGQCRAIVTMKIIAVNGEGRTVTGTIVDVEHIERFARDCLQAFDWRGPLTLEAVQPFGHGHALLCDVQRHLPSWCQASHWGGTNLAVVLLEEIMRRRHKVTRPRAGTMFVRGILELPVATGDLVRLKQHGHLDRFEPLRPVRNGQRTPRGRRRLTVAVTGTSTFDVVNPGLGVARALRVAPEVERIFGLAYGTLESGAYQPALFDEVFRLPDGGSFDALAHRIEEIHRAHRFDVLFPCLDGELPLFIRMRPRLDALGIAHLLPDQKAFDRRAKVHLFSGRLRADWGEFSIPESRFARSEAETVRAVEAVGLPAVVKGPLFMSLPVQSPGEARSAWQQLASLGWTEVIVQRKVAGPYYATSVVCDRSHRVLSALTIKKLATCQRGSTWSAVRVREPQLEADFARFLRAIRWTGPGEGEFVRDEMTDRFFLFEVNPRFTGWVFYSAALGCNQPAAAVHAALGEAVAPAESAGEVAFMRQTTEFPLRPSHLAALATRGHCAMPEVKPYAPPRISHLPFIAFTKHFTPTVTAATDAEEAYDAAQLVREHGSPLYVISERRLREDFARFQRTFSDPRCATRIAYSVKTNYLPAVCAILRSEGAWAEVVSGMEYELARAVGFEPSQVIFNGPHKTRVELVRALGEGAIITLDNFDELEQVAQIARTLPAPAHIGIRFSFKHGAAAWTKFGFSDDNGDTEQALRRIAKNPRLRLDLIHNHCGTFVLVPGIYGAVADRLVGIAQRARALGLAPWIADFGGGYPSSNTLRPEYDFAGGSIRIGDFWAPYAQEILPRLVRAKELFGGRPTLVLEPGRAVVDACTSLLCTVVARKSVERDEDAIILDAGVNLIPTACYYDHPVSRAGGLNGSAYSRHRPLKVFGPLCMQSDRLRESAALPPVRVGDIVRIAHVGAYCHTQSMQFIRTRPATVLLGPTGPEVVRRPETWRDVFALDELPSRLRGAGCSF